MRMPPVKYDVVALNGGWDQISPSLSLKPGIVRDGLNFECAPTGGYARVGGYERYDGRAKPSAATYQLIQVVSFTNTPSVGQTLTGFTSAATGYIAAVTATYMVLTQIVGTFSAGEVVKVGATTIGTSTTLTTSVTSKQYAQYQALAADVYRALIGKVPGSGAVLGVFGMVVSGVDKMYAFRNNAGGTGADLYEASASGWTQVAYKHEVSFTTGAVTTPADGETLTQGANTATVRRVMATGGTWAGGTAAGRFVIDAPAPGAFIAGAATLTSGATVNLSGANAAITVAPSGKYEVFLGNLAGSSGTIRTYGCDGVNRGFEFDGTTYAPIATGATTDTPSHVVVHKNHLLWGIRSSIVFSGPGTPFRYTATDSGGEIATGDSVYAFLIQPGSQTTASLAVYGPNQTAMLYGTSLSTWNFVTFNTGTGAIEYTAQNMAQSLVLDDPGVIAMSTSQDYGNFTQATLTNNIKNFIIAERDNVAYSSLMRDKSQYRLFFSDGYGLYLTIVNGKMLGAMPVFFPNIVNCAWEGMLSTGSGVAYIGDTTGYVHQMDVGSSFDGADIDAFITLNWNAMGSPRVLKRYRHASIEMQGTYYAEISFGYQLAYGTTEMGQADAVTYASGFSPAPDWDSFTWDDFFWDGRTLFPTEVDLRGTAENIQVSISSTGDYIYPFTVNSIINHYSPRRGMR